MAASQQLVDLGAAIPRLIVRARRLQNEGFGSFVASVLLFAVALSFLRVYYDRERILERASRSELIAIVGTPQEPSADSAQLGLLAAALAPVNSDPLAKDGLIPDHEPCPPSDGRCRLLSALEARFTNDARKALDRASAVSPARRLEIRPWPVPSRERPEFAQARCEAAGPVPRMGTTVVIPAQATIGDGALHDRVARAVEVSAGMAGAIEGISRDFANEPALRQLVQAYFISTESVLRLWSSSYHDFCGDFEPYRLWAARSYFTHFWAHPNQRSYATAVYIDYGGHGLVQTHCVPIEERLADAGGAKHGALFGIFCADVALPRPYLQRLQRQLFFQTALVTFRRGHAPFENAEVARPFGLESARPIGVDSAVDRAIDMQATLDATLVADAVRSYLTTSARQPPVLESSNESVDPRTANAPSSVPDDRAPQRIKFDKGDAYLLPIGLGPAGACPAPDPSPEECRQAILFVPNRPALPRWITFAGTCAYALTGAAVAIGIAGIRRRPQADQLRERLALFRNLQVGVVRADATSVILEANDRAEELFLRRLPKPRPTRGPLMRGLDRVGALFGASRASDGPPPRFYDMIDACLREVPTSSGRFEQIFEQDILKLRQLGRSSIYFARVRPPEGVSLQPPRWLRVAASPVMHADQRRDGEALLSQLYATVSEVHEALGAQLEGELRTRHCG